MNVEVEVPASPNVEAPISAEERTWALIGHLSALSFFLTGLGCVLGPLVVWLIKRDSMAFAGDQAKEALNFNLTLLIAGFGLVVLTVITFGIGIVLTVPLGFIMFFYWLVFVIIGGINANNGVRYRYPMTWRLIS